MKLTRSNIYEFPAGHYVAAFNPHDDDAPALLGVFVRTNTVYSPDGEFLFVTIKQEDGKQRVFDLDKYIAYGESV